jgi:hypothetical protein
VSPPPLLIIAFFLFDFFLAISCLLVPRILEEAVA